MHNIVRKYLQLHCNIQSLKQFRKIGEKSEKYQSSIGIHSAIRIAPPKIMYYHLQLNYSTADYAGSYSQKSLENI